MLNLTALRFGLARLLLNAGTRLVPHQVDLPVGNKDLLAEVFRLRNVIQHFIGLRFTQDHPERAEMEARVMARAQEALRSPPTVVRGDVRIADILHALERAIESNQQSADKLHAAGDYDAEFFACDAESLRHAWHMLRTVEGEASEVETLPAVPVVVINFVGPPTREQWEVENGLDFPF